MSEMRRQIQAEIEAAQSQRAARSSRAGVMDAEGSHADTHPTQVGATGPLLPSVDQQAKRAGSPQVYRSPVVRGCCRALKAEVLRQQAEGRFHLSLSDQEFLHLYYALDNARSKLRKAIGKGLAEHGDLHASDSVWQKIQQILSMRELKAHGGWR